MLELSQVLPSHDKESQLIEQKLRFRSRILAQLLDKYSEDEIYLYLNGADLDDLDENTRKILSGILWEVIDDTSAADIPGLDDRTILNYLDINTALNSTEGHIKIPLSRRLKWGITALRTIILIMKELNIPQTAIDTMLETNIKCATARRFIDNHHAVPEDLLTQMDKEDREDLTSYWKSIEEELFTDEEVAKFTPCGIIEQLLASIRNSITTVNLDFAPGEKSADITGRLRLYHIFSCKKPGKEINPHSEQVAEAERVLCLLQFLQTYPDLKKVSDILINAL